MFDLQLNRDICLNIFQHYKLELLQIMVFESKNLKQDEMLPFFMSVMKISKEKKISFTQEEMELILDVLKGNASKEDLTKINQLMQMRKVLS